MRTDQLLFIFFCMIFDFGLYFHFQPGQEDWSNCYTVLSYNTPRIKGLHARHRPYARAGNEIGTFDTTKVEESRISRPDMYGIGLLSGSEFQVCICAHAVNKSRCMSYISLGLRSVARTRICWLRRFSVKNACYDKFSELIGSRHCLDYRLVPIMK